MKKIISMFEVCLIAAVITLLVIIGFQGNWIYKNADTIRTIKDMEMCYGETLEDLNFKMELVKEIEYNRGETLEDLQSEFMR